VGQFRASKWAISEYRNHLLQATEGILQWWDTTASQGRDGVEPSAFKEARAAIAKAQGGAA
jgi:hypothetical protein